MLLDWYQFVYGTSEEAEQNEKHNSKKDRTPVAEYNKVRGSLLRLSTGLEGRNRGVENQQSNLRQCDYGLISHQCHSTVHVKSQSIVHFPPKYPAFMMKRYSVQNKIRLIFPEIKHVKRAWHVQTIVPHILDYAVKCQGWSIKICIKKNPDTALYSVQQQ